MLTPFIGGLMKLIAHRGNWRGRDKSLENSLNHILSAIEHNFDVEVDCWHKDGEFFLGHDGPEHEVEIEFLNVYKDRLWIHAKDYITFCKLLSEGFHCFFHDQDEYTLTSDKIIWAYSGKFISSDYPSIAVMPELSEGYIVPEDIYGVCSDNLTMFM